VEFVQHLTKKFYVTHFENITKTHSFCCKILTVCSIWQMFEPGMIKHMSMVRIVCHLMVHVAW